MEAVGRVADGLLEVAHRARGDLDDEAVLARDVVTLQDLRAFLKCFLERPLSPLG